MENQDNAWCPVHDLPGLLEEYAPIPPESLPRKLRLFVRRKLNSRQVRTFKTKSSHMIDVVFTIFGIRKRGTVLVEDPPSSSFKPGNLVRVRSREEIQATLNRWGQLKGCMFMSEEMSPYCGTIQRVFKPMERFVDERDYHVKKTHGIILLQGLHCQGTVDYGRCDRACFFFWREEWLEKLNDAGLGKVKESEK
jgi:hypothetical protein